MTRPLCSLCRLPQFDTPSGPVCENGHGGVDPLDDPAPDGLITIIAGSREGVTLDDVTQAVQAAPWRPSVVVSGMAPGTDRLGERWAALNGVPVVGMRAAWSLPGGSVDRGAGYRRNVKMAERSEALIAIWDGQSPGTRHMIQTALAWGRRVFVWKPRSAR